MKERILATSIIVVLILLLGCSNTKHMPLTEAEVNQFIAINKINKIAIEMGST